MSGGKKKYPKKRTYSEGEVKRAVRQAADDAVKRSMLISALAVRDMFDLDDEGVLELLNTIIRYVGYLNDGIIDIDTFSESLSRQTGIDLHFSRW